MRTILYGTIVSSVMQMSSLSTTFVDKNGHFKTGYTEDFYQVRHCNQFSPGNWQESLSSFCLQVNVILTCCNLTLDIFQELASCIDDTANKLALTRIFVITRTLEFGWRLRQLFFLIFLEQAAAVYESRMKRPGSFHISSGLRPFSRLGSGCPLDFQTIC